MALPLAQPSVGSRNPPPPLSTVTLPQLRMLFQSTHEDRQSAEALAETGERIVKSPLQRTLTAHIMSRWANHEGTLAHSEAVDRDVGVAVHATFSCEARSP